MISLPRFARITARFAALLIPFALFVGTAVHAAPTLRIGGTGSALGTFAILAAAWQQHEPGRTAPRIVPNLGSGGGLRALGSGAIEIALISRPLSPEEAGAGLVALPYGRSPFVLVTSAPRATDVTTAHLVDVLMGRKAEWASGTPIRFVYRPPHDVDNAMLGAIDPTVAAALKDGRSRPGLAVAMTDQEAVLEAIRLPGGMTATTLALLLSENHSSARVLNLNGVAPSVRSLVDGKYPHAKTFYLVTRGAPAGEVHDFVAFVRSARGRAILEANGHQVLP
jgi:phosphate transport system substrate-binding protein